MSDAELDELEGLANAATPGPWWGTEKPFDSRDTRVYPREGSLDAICTMQLSDRPNWRNDRRYIAASHPETIKALIAEVRRLRAESSERELEALRLQQASDDANLDD